MGLRYKEKRCISFGKDDTSYSLYLLDMLFLTKSEGLSPFRQKKGKHLVQKRHVPFSLLKIKAMPYTVQIVFTIKAVCKEVSYSLEKLKRLSSVQYCMLWTFISTLFFYIATDISMYTVAALIAGIVLAFINLLEDEVIHQKIRGD